MEKIFVNFTNHPSEMWGVQQRREAEKYGEILDVPFPAVDPYLSKEDVKKIAEEYVQKIGALKPAAVLCQGEFSLSYQVIQKLKEKKIMVLAACSKRNVTYQGEQKIVEFVFEQFREF